MGHLISKDGIKPTQSRIQSVHDTPAPRNRQELPSFLGMVSYNAKFMPSLSHTLNPLYQLLKKNTKWMWKTEHQTAFTTVKRLLCQECMLVHYDINKPLKLFCDASQKGLGACLVYVMLNGEERPVAYTSRLLSPAEQHYAQIEREALAIIFAVCRFHQFLYGRTFTLVTDH